MRRYCGRWQRMQHQQVKEAGHIMTVQIMYANPTVQTHLTLHSIVVLHVLARHKLRHGACEVLMAEDGALTYQQQASHLLLGIKLCLCQYH